MLGTNTSHELRLVQRRYDVALSRKHHLSPMFWLALGLRFWSVAQDVSPHLRTKLIDRSDDCRARATSLIARRLKAKVAA